MRLTTTLALLTLGCQTGEPLSPSEALSPDDALPPPPLVVPACAPGSAFELNGVAYAELQSAFDAANQGDTVVACAGTHPIGQVYSYTLGVTLAGETSDPADVAITGGAITLSASLPQPPTGPTTISGLTFFDTGVVVQAPQVLAQDVVFVGANAALSAEAHAVDVRRATFTGSEGWAALDIGPLNRELSVTLDDVQFENNHVAAHVVSVRNSDVSAATGLVRLRDVDLLDNLSDGVSTALLSVGEDVEVQIVGGQIIGNRAPGGGIVELDGLVGRSRIRGWTLSDNEGSWETLSVEGWGGRLSIRDTGILRNTLLNAPITQGVVIISAIRTELTNVDFGAGADTNLPLDVASCSTNYGFLASSVINVNALCPR